MRNSACNLDALHLQPRTPTGQVGHRERIAPRPGRPGGDSAVFLVETGESRTLEMAPSIVDALRDLSGALARLADTLDEASSNSLEL